MLRTVMFGAFDAATYCMFFEAGFPDLFFCWSHVQWRMCWDTTTCPDGKTELTIEYLQRVNVVLRFITQSGHEAHHP